MIEFIIPGKAQPAGSKRAIPFARANGQGLGVRVTDDNPKAGAWKERVALVAAAAYGGPPLTCALRLVVVFNRLRPKGHFRKNGLLKPGAPLYPTTKPDATKLLRGLEDACTKILWADDAQIVEQQVTKRYDAREETRVLVFDLQQQPEPIP
jgi:Holliday junction resolvase RusA-like endonuclease